MPLTVKISENLLTHARSAGKIEKRTINSQIEHWALIGKLAEENPDMPYSLLREILAGLNELESGNYSEFKFD